MAVGTVLEHNANDRVHIKKCQKLTSFMSSNHNFTTA